MKLILEKARYQHYEPIGTFDSIEDIDKWILDNWGISFDEYKSECMEWGNDEPTRQDWYDENEIRITEQ